MVYFRTSSSAKSKLSGIFIGKKIDADTMESLEEALISSDLGVSASQKIVKEFEKNYSGKTSDQEELLEALSKSISNILEPLEKELIVSDDHHPHIMMLVGVNGSGKTTAIRSITGLLDIQNGDITKGQITVDGDDITNLNPSKIVEKGIAQVMEGRRIFSELSVVENLRLGGHTNSANIQNNIDRVLDMFPALKDRQKGEAGYLSGGEQQMLAIGRALMSEPEYLLLDEPSLGLAPKLVDQIAELIQEINKQGVTVLLVEQNANMALNISDHGYIMETGNIVMDNDSKKLLNDEDVREFYLGLNAEGTKRKSFKDVKHYKRKKRWLS